MRRKTTVKGLLFIISLVALSLILTCGCNGKSQAERNKQLMDSLSKEGVGDTDNRNRYNNDEYRQGYDAGEKTGYLEGKADYERGENFTPSITKFRSGRKMYDQGHQQGYMDGYYNAYEDCIRTVEEASGKHEEKEETKPTSDYDEGYGKGWVIGFRDGADDNQYDYDYNPCFGNLEEEEGSDEYKRGLKDGYDKGYDEGYKFEP